MKKPRTNIGINRIIKALGFSVQGIQAAWKFEAAFKQEAYLCLVMCPLAFWIADTSIELILLLCSVVLVLLVELINSAIEAAVDRFGEAHHELSGRAKDMGSAAVLLSLIIVMITWGAIFFDR